MNMMRDEMVNLMNEMKKGNKISIEIEDDNHYSVSVDGNGLVITFLLSNLFKNLNEKGFDYDTIAFALDYAKYESKGNNENE